MGSVKGVMWRGAVLLALVAVTFPSYADVTSERSSSILIFPKVMVETSDPAGPPTADTIIQISNTSNSMAFAHCFYVNGAPLDSTSPPGTGNPAQCQEVDFEIYLTKQQPTYWLVSSGRRMESDPTCNKTVKNCFNAGLDPGAIPPVPDIFTGELTCIEVDSSGAPLNGNHLKGEATIVTPDGDASKYNAIGVLGLNTNANANNSDNILCLGGAVSDSCPTGAEYNACPQTLILNHFASRASDPVIDELVAGPSVSQVATELTLVPCTQNFESQIPGGGVVQFLITNEFEQVYSTSTPVSCWANLSLGDVNPVFSTNVLGTRFAQTRMTPATAGQSGFVGVSEEFHFLTPSAQASRAAANLHGEGARVSGDLITIPGGF